MYFYNHMFCYTVLIKIIIYSCILGSKKSLNPSPSRLNPTTASAMAIPGNIAVHGASSKKLLASLSINPHDGVGGGVPKPKN